ncbi:hypothetical protein H4S08_001670 [Coemansia sp. RSA 1365]|nr:hypothetical protein H4S08_001670 [Coemansia sp. RSA 1365]
MYCASRGMLAAVRAAAGTVAAPSRAMHTTTAAHVRRRSNRKAELAAARVAEAEAARRAEEQLRKLKDTKFLNSLEKPDRLFDSTQITQRDAAAEVAAGQQGGVEQDKTGKQGGDKVRRKADSGKYACLVKPSEIELVTTVGPKAEQSMNRGFSLNFMHESTDGNPSVQSDIVRRVVALENSNAKGVSQYNINTAVEMFGRSEGDSGSPEVQAAVWTVRINQLEDHLRANHKDHQNRRAYTKLQHKRAKILKYLKRKSLERYYVCLKQLGLTKDMVVGEILIPKRL